MKAVFARSPFDIQIRELEPRQPGPDEVLVRVRACGLCGTDLHFARDWQGEHQPLGHEIAAEVVEIGRGHVPYKSGDKVIVEDLAQCGICRHCKSGRPYLCRNMYDLKGQPGMAEMMTVNYHLLEPFDAIDWTHASLVEPMAVAYNTVLNGRIPLGGSVVVMGPGPIGLMCVYLAKMRGAEKVLLIGSSRKRPRGRARLEAGVKLGADAVVEALETDPVGEVKKVFPEGADSVLVTSAPKTLAQSLDMVRFGGTVSFIGIDLGGKNTVEIDVNKLVFGKISLIPTFAEPAQNFPDTIRILRNGLFDASLLVNRTFSFDELRDVFMASDSGQAPILKAVLVPK
ncbi:MAG: alcohol dehydrogenase catalytic domain-containing protein [Spirochaetaceae bacterium]|nr:MAG: alcohol dehydrogenase catalytic domain-containing protein [Spirochaetaceae bacterium]